MCCSAAHHNLWIGLCAEFSVSARCWESKNRFWRMCVYPYFLSCIWFFQTSLFETASVAEMIPEGSPEAFKVKTSRWRSTPVLFFCQNWWQPEIALVIMKRRHTISVAQNSMFNLWKRKAVKTFNIWWNCNVLYRFLAIEILTST